MKTDIILLLNNCTSLELYLAAALFLLNRGKSNLYATNWNLSFSRFSIRFGKLEFTKSLKSTRIYVTEALLLKQIHSFIRFKLLNITQLSFTGDSILGNIYFLRTFFKN